MAAVKSIRAARPDCAPIYVIMDNLSANKPPRAAPSCRGKLMYLMLCVKGAKIRPRGRDLAWDPVGRRGGRRRASLTVVALRTVTVSAVDGVSLSIWRRPWR